MTNNILELPPNELLIYLQKNYSIEIPKTIECSEDLVNAGKIIGKITGYYSFLMAAYMEAKLNVRLAKQEKMPKEIIAAYIDKRDILKEYNDILKMQYTSISRMITIKKQVDEELKMLNLQ